MPKLTTEIHDFRFVDKPADGDEVIEGEQANSASKHLIAGLEHALGLLKHYRERVPSPERKICVKRVSRI